MPIESGGSSVYDEDKSHRDHMARRSDKHRADVQRYMRIMVCIGSLEYVDKHDIGLIFEPYGAARATAWLQTSCRAADGQPMIGLVLDTQALRSAYTKEFHHAPTYVRLVQYAEDLGRRPNDTGRIFASCMNEAMTRRKSSVGMFRQATALYEVQADTERKRYKAWQDDIESEQDALMKVIRG